MTKERKIELDPSKLTMKDWRTIDAFAEGKGRVGQALEIIVRCSDWTEEEIDALPASSIRAIIDAISEAMAAQIQPKN
jgi:hypothetical protein